MRWSSEHLVRVLAKGGILTPSHLLKILGVVKSSGNKHLHFGSRQDILFQVSDKELNNLESVFAGIQTDYVIHGRAEVKAQNIVSSYVSSDMTAATSWISSGNYLSILENFDYLPNLRINITNPKQGLVPLFSGHLNFVASNVKDYWYLFIRRNFTAPTECWPVLVLSGDIAKLSHTIENNWQKQLHSNLIDFFDYINEQLNYNWRKIETPFKIEALPSYEYEGFGRMNNSKNFWAGFYWRNNCYDIAFLEEVCNLCLRTNISKICLTPWKSFIVKDIRESDLIQWQRLLGWFGINMRHSSFELNWHLPLRDKSALRLKRSLVRKFDKEDVCVHGLTFGIKNKPEPSFCTIQIERTPFLPFLKRWNISSSYTILFAKDFNPNTCEYKEYLSHVPRHRLAEELQLLTRRYYAQLTKTNENIPKVIKKEKTENRVVYQCIHCLTVYDEKIALTPFNQLSERYSCELCSSPKADFKSVYLDQLLQEAIA